MSRALYLGASVALALFVACAGKNEPDVTAELADQVRTAYEGGSVGGTGGGSGAAVAGSGGGGGSPAASGAGGSAGSAVAGLAGSSGSGGGGSTGAAGTGGSGSTSSSCDGFALLAANCGTSGCHGEGSNLENFAASEEDARAFIGKPGTLACTGQGLVIDADDPAESLMVRKLADDAPCGQQMPISGEPLSAAEIECIEDWIGSL